MPSTPSDDSRETDHGPAGSLPAATRLRFADFTFDVDRRELSRKGASVDMPVRVFECLDYLIAHRERAVGRDELAQAIFRRADVSDGQLSQLVLRARRCVDDDGQAQRAILTVPRFGFRWVAETHIVDRADSVAAGVDSDPAEREVGTTHGVAGPPQGVELHAAAGHRWRSMLGIGVVLTLLAGALAFFAAGRPPVAPAHRTAALQGAVVVLPARVEGGAEAAWIRLGLMDFTAERLRRAGLPVPPSENTLALLPTAAPGHSATRPGRALEPALGTPSLVIETHVLRQPRSWRVTLSARDRDGLVRRAAADGPDPLAATRLACDRLLATLGRTAPADARAPLGLEERLQRVKAAILANQLGTARRILLAAPPSQLSQPQLRFRLAQVDYRAGALAQAERSLSALATDPAVRDDAVFRARVMIYLGGVHMRREALSEAERDFDAALDALDGHDTDLEHGSALNGRASVRAALGRIDASLEDFGAARTRLLRAGDRLGVARVDANLGALELERGHPAQALDYLQAALAVFVDAAAVNEMLVTRSALSAAQLQRLDANAAITAAEASIRLLPRTTDPTLRLAAHLDRANALVALGRFEDARRALSDPAIAAPTTPAYEHRRTQSLVELAWRSGDASGARALSDRALADWPVTPGDTLRDWVALRRTQARMADGESGVASAALATVDPASVPSLLAAAIADGAAERADSGYRSALALAESRGATAEIVDVAALYLPWLIAHGRLAQADALVGRVAPWSARSYDVARMQWQLAVARGDASQSEAARTAMSALAGERRASAKETGLAERW